MAAADRLSTLADDLLQRILSFAPAKEAAASAALSRRWRPLWPRTAALNLDSRPYPRQYSHGYLHDRFDDFFRHAKAALASRRETALKRLTLYLGVDAYLVGGRYHRSSHDGKPEHDARAGGLLTDPAAAALEELRIAAEHSYQNSYVAPLASLPCAATTLWVLELDCCVLEPSASRLAFPRLTDLTLRNCTYFQGCLQVVLDAAPALMRLALVNVTNQPPKPLASEKDRYYVSKAFNLPLCLRSRTVTALLLETSVCRDELDDSHNIGIQLDMPSLRSFRYKGFPFKISMTSPAPGLARVHLDTNLRERGVYKCEPTARALANFSSTRALKLHLNLIENIISNNGPSYQFQNSIGNQNPDEEVILPTFPNLKLLEIDASFNYRDNNTALALAMQLCACPGLSELRLTLNMSWHHHYDRKIKEQAVGPFAQSVERFNRLGSMCAEHRVDVELGGVSDLPDAFTSSCEEFGCLRTSLQKVTLQFKSKELNCFQVQLVKFLVENAMVLEEMHVEDGDQFWPDHLRDKLARWRVDAFRRRNLPDTAGFRVFQLANPVVEPEVHY